MKNVIIVLLSRGGLFFGDALTYLAYLVARSCVRGRNSQTTTPSPAYTRLQKVLSWSLLLANFVHIVILALYFKNLGKYMVEVCTTLIKSVNCHEQGETWRRLCAYFAAMGVFAFFVVFSDLNQLANTPPERLHSALSLVLGLLCFQLSYVFCMPLAYPQLFFSDIDREHTITACMGVAFTAIVVYQIGLIYWLRGTTRLLYQPQWWTPRAAETIEGSERDVILMEDRT